MKKYKKTTAFRLEPKELDWLENQCKNKKLSPSTVLRNLIRDRIALDVTFQPRPSVAAPAANASFGGKTLKDWEEILKKRNEQPTAANMEVKPN